MLSHRAPGRPDDLRLLHEDALCEPGVGKHRPDERLGVDPVILPGGHVPLLSRPADVADILNRTETAMTQQHCFLATELMLKAQKDGRRVNLAR